MPYLALWSGTQQQTSLQLYVDDLQNAGSWYSSITIRNNTTGATSGNLASGSWASPNHSGRFRSITWTNSSLTCGTSYSYTATVITPTGASSTYNLTQSTSACPPPPAPAQVTGLSVSARAGTVTQLSMSWNASSGATGYYIDLWNGSSYSHNHTVTGTSTNITGLNPNTSYTVGVRAYNGTGTATRTISSATTNNLATPWSISSTNTSYTSFDILYQCFSNHTTSVEFQYNTSASTSGASSVWQTPSSGINTRSITGLSSGTTYFYRLRSSNNFEGGNSQFSSYSDWFSATTTTLAVPWSISATAKQSAFDISYQCDSTNTTSVEFQYNTSQTTTGAQVVWQTPSSGINTRSITDVTGGTTYWYRLRAHNGSTVQSAYSSWNSVTPLTPKPTKPSAVQVSSRGDGSLTVTWGASTGAQTYELRYKLQNLAIWTTFSTSLSGTSSQVTGLDFGRGYHFEVRGKNSTSGDGDWSDTSTIFTNPKIPFISSFTATNNSVTIEVGDTMAGNWDDIVVHMMNNNNVWQASRIITLANYNSGNRSVLFDNLTANTTYKFYTTSRFTPSGQNQMISGSSFIMDIPTRIKPLEWRWITGQNASGYKIQGGQFRMGATEWASFCARINEFRAYRNATLFPPVNFTSVANGGQLTATVYNQARGAIAVMSPTGISDRVKGDPCLASHFNTLMDVMNSL